MKKRLSLILLLIGCFGIVFSYARVSARGIMPFKSFDLADYDINKTLSNDELAKEITAYANYALASVNECSDDDTIKSDRGLIEINANYTNYCSDIHAADYLRLSYLYFVNAAHNLPATEALHYILPDWKFEHPSVQRLWSSLVAVSEDGRYGWKGGEGVARNSIKETPYMRNVNFVTSDDGVLTNSTITMLGSLNNRYNYLYPVISSIRSCNLMSRDEDEHNNEERRKVFFNGEQAMENCEETITSERGEPMEEETRKACQEIEPPLRNTKFDVRETISGGRGHTYVHYYEASGPCAESCQEELRKGCNKGQCTGACESVSRHHAIFDYGTHDKDPLGDCDCYRLCRDPNGGCNDGTKKPYEYYKKVPKTSLDPGSCNQCLIENMQKENPACVRTSAQEKELLTALETCKTPSAPPQITCSTTINILSTTTAEMTTKKILDSIGGLNPTKKIASPEAITSHPRWLPLTDQEKELMNYGADFTDLNDTSIDLRPDVQSICSERGFGALVCVVVRFLSSVSDGVFKLLESMMVIPTKFIASRQAADGTPRITAEAPNYPAWNTFRNIANILLVIITIILILAQITGYKLETYSLKRTLPTLILAAILINLSYFFCQIAVDLSNIIGSGIKKGAENLAQEFSSGDGLGITKQTADILMYGLAIGTIGAGVAVAAFVGLSVLIPLIFSVLVTSIMVLLVLTFRQLVVVVMIVLSPVAFALIALPSTRSLFSRWLRIFVSSLAVYPIIALLFSSGKLAHDIMSSSVNNPGPVIAIFSIIVAVLPLFMLPTVLIRAMKTMPVIGGRIQNLLSGVSKRATSRLMQTTPMQGIKQAEDRKKLMDKEGKSRPSWKNPLRWARSGINRNLINKLPIYRDVRGAMSVVDPERWEQIQSISSSFERTASENYLINASTGQFDGQFNQDELMAAILTSSAQGDASHEIIVKALDQARSKYGLEESYVNQAMNSAMANYLSEGEMGEYAMFKKHRDMTVGSTSGFSISLEDFDSQMDDDARRDAIRTELIRTPASRIPKFTGYLNVNPDDPEVSRTTILAKQVIEGYTDDQGNQHDGLFKENKFWRDDMLKNSREKGLKYIKHLQREALRSSSHTPPNNPPDNPQ